MPALIDLTGKRFGQLSVLKRVKPTTKANNAHYSCQCDCGGTVVVPSNNLRSGNSTSCGCYRREFGLGNSWAATHGKSQTVLYTCWRNMLARCYDPHNKSYLAYGGRDPYPVRVCAAWRTNVTAFITWAEENGYEKGFDIDRIDNYKGYSPNNCQWIPHIDNCNKKLNNVRMSLFGQIKTLAEWSRDVRCNVHYNTLQARYNKGVRGKAILG